MSLHVRLMATCTLALCFCICACTKHTPPMQTEPYGLYVDRREIDQTRRGFFINDVFEEAER
jgi:outer membrane protein assembly factor BamE (lipoprotein component of BamABCDE complex)